MELPRTQPKDKRKARGAASNVPGRFELDRIAIADGWDLEEDLPPLRTQVSNETVRSLITRNASPDLPFDRSINPYRGCEHGCIYCFARPSHAFLGLSPGLDFETRLVARPNAAAMLEKELRKPRYKVAPIAIGTNTDPYQPIERDYKIMRACLKVLAEYRHPVAIVTKGTMVERDIDVLSGMARHGLIRVGVSITTLDADLSRRLEPRVAVPNRRLQTISRLSEAGIPVRIFVSPIIPALTDHEAEALLQAGRDAGASAASWSVLRLPREVSPLFQDWLAEHVPDRAARVMARVREMHGGRDYDPRWGVRMRGEGTYADMLAQRVKLAIRRLGLDASLPELRCDLFRHPPRAGDQLSLL